MGKIKKVIAGVLAVAVAGGGSAAALSYMKKSNETEVMVVSVNSIKSDYYMPSTTLEGHVTTNVTQEITVDDDMIIENVYVQAGDTVSIGDPLITFDMTLVEMELKIAQLRDQQYDQQLDKAADRLYSLENGGPIVDESYSSGVTGSTSGGTSSGTSSSSSPSGSSTDDNLSSVSGMDDDLSSVGGMDDDLSSVSGMDDLEGKATFSGMEGAYLAAAVGPVLLAAADFGSGEEAFAADQELITEDPGTASYDASIDDQTWADQGAYDDELFSAEGATTQDPYMDGGTSAGVFGDSGVQYQDPTVGDFSDGEQTQGTPVEDGFSSGEYDVPKPTPTPAPGESFTDDMYDGIQGQPAFTDGTAYFYQILDYDSQPYCGTGTEEDPYVFLCSSSGGRVRVRGSFFNKMAGYNQDGTRVEQEGGSWFQLEFHDLDIISDPQNRTASCIGYYLIDGSLLEEPVNMDAELEMTLAEASQFQDTTDISVGGSSGLVDSGSTTTISREDAIETQKNLIENLQLNKQENQLKITQLQKQLNRQSIASKLEGTVDYVGDPVTGATTEDVFMRIKSKDGYYVSGTVSELMLDEVTEGTELNCMSYSSGNFAAKVLQVSDYPISAQYYMGDGNPNVSYYTYSAAVEDPAIVLQDQDWLTVTLQTDVATEGSLVIQKSFVRTEDGVNYVYKNDNGVLKKQQVTVGANVNGGYSVLIKAGLSSSDWIAFPYGEDVKEGAKTVEGTLEKLYGY